MTKVFGFHYTLKDKEGTKIDSSEGRDPMLVLAGKMSIIPTLEQKLLTMKVGDKAHVEIAAKDAYGEAREDLRLTVKKNQFPKDTNIQPGMQFRVNQDPNMPPFTVIEIEGDDVKIDGNHPLAGVDLFFDVELMEMREATAEEIAHGHAHGPGGHHHH